ncbi:VWA domain-containing protein [Methylobrevis albus]|uniref:VWA domain-containing protein n=1 Tax=Methylobrevis albus TaxID=2793297 RepID=A0A931I5L2_9HYPH|nr:VWA domain-containing protein [Methylobrevis albus]MBH0239256.1 VWA domain-containing protein [Methylobrevis albus]
MIEFATPIAFAALPLPLLVRRLLQQQRSTAAALRLPDAMAGRSRAGNTEDAGSGQSSLLIAAAAWVALVTALAGPQLPQPAAALPMSGREIVLVLDFSGSMERKDFTLGGVSASRIDVVKHITSDFIRRRAGDRVGLVLFAEMPQVAAVPTFDLAAVESVLMDTEIGTLGRSTAIGDGLGLALKLLDGSQSESRAVVLLSDGTTTAGEVSASSAAALAEALGIRVHTIALGTDEEITGSAGAASLVDVVALKDIADRSGGEAFRVRSTTDLEQVTATIDRLETERSVGAPVAIARDLWAWPAAASLMLCLVGFAIGRRSR